MNYYFWAYENNKVGTVDAVAHLVLHPYGCAYYNTFTGTYNHDTFRENISTIFYNFYIINETSYELLVSVSEISGTKTKGIFANAVPKQDYAQIYTANFSAVGKWPTFHLQIIRHARSTQVQTQPISKEFRVKPLDLINSKEKVEMLTEKVWLYEIDKPEEDIGLDKLKSHFISHRPKGR